MTAPPWPFASAGVDAAALALPRQVTAATGTWWGRLVLAVTVLVVGYLLTSGLVRYLGRPIARRFRRPSLTRTVLRAVRALGVVASLLVALSVLGLQLGNIVLSVTVFSAVLGIVLAPIVGSIISGVFVLADQPYEVGDMIELAGQGEGTRGFVEDITLRYTKVFTLDNTFLVIPNSTMRERDVVNYSAEDERTRLSLQLLVTYESDVSTARTLMERAARGVEGVISGGPDIRIGSARYPAKPTCYIDEYGDHGVLLTLRYWGKQPYKLLTLRSQVNEGVWTALEDEPGVDIAYPHQHHVFDETSGQAQVRVQRGGRSHGPAGGAPGEGGSPGRGDRPDDGGAPGSGVPDDGGAPGGSTDPPGDDSGV